MDKVGNAFAGNAGVRTVNDASGERKGAIKLGMHFGNDILTVHHNRVGVFGQTQGDMQRGAVFTGVDFVAAAHGLHSLLDLRAVSQIAQQGQGFFSDAVFAVIEQ